MRIFTLIPLLKLVNGNVNYVIFDSKRMRIILITRMRIITELIFVFVLTVYGRTNTHVVANTNNNFSC